MDLRDLFRFVFWGWTIVATVILIRRAIVKRSTRFTDPTELRDPTTPLVDEPLRAMPGTVDPAAPLTDATGTGTGPLPGGVAPGASIFGPAPESGRNRGRIADLVEGIRMPCGLAPVVSFVPRPGTRESVAFSTDLADVGEVGREVGVELRRLGFALQPVTTTEVLATRDDARITVSVHSEVTSVVRGDVPAFPHVPAGAVVVELST